jgi:WhiB family transcriptional regulator, redox-sensing transcriptional regulator
VWSPPDLPYLPRAACRRQGVDPEWFFPAREGRTSGAHALEVCAGCPERDPCLNFALQDRELVGVWGGTTHNQRLLLRRAARRVS